MAIHLRGSICGRPLILLVAVLLVMRPDPALATGLSEAQVIGGSTAKPDVMQAPISQPIQWPFAYAEAQRAVPVHSEPGGAQTGTLSALGRWVAFVDRAQVGDTGWIALATGGWAPTSAVAARSLPTFRGVHLGPDVRTGHHNMGVGFVVGTEATALTRPVDGRPISTLPRYTVVRIKATQRVSGSDWYAIGDGVWAPATEVRHVPWNPQPEGIPDGAKWIDVDLTHQILVAYEGDRPVFTTLISTGLPRTPTWEGISRVDIKLRYGKMSGGDPSLPGDYYWLDHVPHTQYFHRGYGLHAAYWHDDFGRVKSHGCVNLSPADAEWLFRWTTPTVAPDAVSKRAADSDRGTFVWTHR